MSVSLRTKLLLLFALAVAGLVVSDRFIPETGWWSSVHILGHHLFALVAGASLAGVFFELLARREMVEEFKKAFLDDHDISALFGSDARARWMRNILKAQIRGDESLSEAIYSDVVEPFMAAQKFRPDFLYQVAFSDVDHRGWSLEAIRQNSAGYVMLKSVNNYRQVFREVMAEVNVSVIVGSGYAQLHNAFIDPACIFRESLVLERADADRVRKELSGIVNVRGLKEVPDIYVELWANDHRTPCTRVDFDEPTGCLKFWFNIANPKRDMRLRASVQAPYQSAAGQFVIVFGEPTASPRVTFQPGPCSLAENVHVVHFLQGGGAPEVEIGDSAIQVNFPHPDAKRWILPTSGLVFLWGTQRASSLRP